MKHIVRALALPFLTVAYIFYFLYYGIFELVTSEWRKVNSWELHIAWWLFVFAPLFAIHIFWMPIMVSLLKGNWEWMALMVAPFCLFPFIWIPAVIITEADDGLCWLPRDVFNLLFPPKPKKKIEIVKLDTDERTARKALDKEFPGMEKEYERIL